MSAPGKRPHYRGSYQTRAAKVRSMAYADPTTRCWRCGRTRAEHGRAWHAGHLVDGQVDGPLAAECEQCNTSEGARLGHQRRRALSQLRTTRDW
jgi:hypothetical protein